MFGFSDLGSGNGKDRFVYDPVASEKKRREQETTKWDNKVYVKRYSNLISEWLDGMEKSRWNKMNQGFEKEQRLLNLRSQKTKTGLSR